MNFKIDVYSNNDSVRSPEELAKLLEQVIIQIRRKPLLPRTRPEKYSFVKDDLGGINGSYKISPVDIAMGLDP